jgi:hypothetical protein
MLDDWGFIPNRSRIFMFTDSGTYLASSVCTLGVKLTTYIHLRLRSMMNGVEHLLTLRHRDNFSFTLNIFIYHNHVRSLHYHQS